jgi:sugar phosphate isomerase/epimerase
VNLSCCIWALSGPEEEVLNRIAGAGFRWIDVRPDALAEEEAREKARDLGLRVSCVAASFGMPEGAALDSPDAGSARKALAHTEQALAHGEVLGATAAYVVPGPDGGREALDRYAASLAYAADRAQMHGLRLCIEHFPGRALPTVAATLDFLKEVGHPNLYLLFDIGHAQMSGENAGEAIRSAGPRLGYVHLDDNDGAGDLHLSLTDGVLTEVGLGKAFDALKGAGYTGTVSLELSPKLPDPLGALKRSREIVMGITRGIV